MKDIYMITGSKNDRPFEEFNYSGGPSTQGPIVFETMAIAERYCRERLKGKQFFIQAYRLDYLLNDIARGRYNYEAYYKARIDKKGLWFEWVDLYGIDKDQFLLSERNPDDELVEIDACTRMLIAMLVDAAGTAAATQDALSDDSLPVDQKAEDERHSVARRARYALGKIVSEVFQEIVNARPTEDQVAMMCDGDSRDMKQYVLEMF